MIWAAGRSARAAERGAVVSPNVFVIFMEIAFCKSMQATTIISTYVAQK
jgi:hypothetical protein